jgi:hypothetical protein
LLLLGLHLLLLPSDRLGSLPTQSQRDAHDYHEGLNLHRKRFYSKGEPETISHSSMCK